MAGTAATVGGGAGGWVAGAAAGSAILLGIGTFISRIAVSLIGGTVAGKTTDAVVGVFIEDAADEMVNSVKVVLEEINDAMTDSDFEAELA